MKKAGGGLGRNSSGEDHHGVGLARGEERARERVGLLQVRHDLWRPAGEPRRVRAVDGPIIDDDQRGFCGLRYEAGGAFSVVSANVQVSERLAAYKKNK